MDGQRVAQLDSAPLPRRDVGGGVRPPRVLMVVESSGGGTGRHVMDLAQGLVHRGCAVHIVYSPLRADEIFLNRLAGLPRIRRTATPMRAGIHPSDWSAVGVVRRVLREDGPFDIIHGHSSKGGAIARIAGIGGGAKVFYTLHGFIMMDAGLAAWKRFFYLAVEWGLAQFTHRIIAVAPQEQRSARRLGLGVKRTVLIPNGVNCPEPMQGRAAARRAIGLHPDDIAVGFVGRLVEQKAPDVLLRAFAKAAAGAAALRLVVVGDGPMRAELHDLADRLNIVERIIWLGERDAGPLYIAFDLFALASRKEGLPYVVLEAMAAGLPVVATATAGVEILVLPEQNGVVTPAGAVGQFAQALRRLGVDPGLRDRFSKVSLRLAQTFTVDRMVEGTLAAYRKSSSG